MKPVPATAPRATIVMTARERHSLAEAAIDSIIEGTATPFRFIYLDVDSPQWLRNTMASRKLAWNLEVIRFDEPLWPQQARRRIADQITTDYVVFIDNDVIVEPGWLEALVSCADETHAGIVAPLYLWGDGIRPAKIHMAGGTIVESEAEGGRILDETHQHANADPRQVQLTRTPCDFAEYHCMLVRTELLRDPAVLDPAIRCVHEHIDTALVAKRHGLPVYLEPAARVTYLASAEYMLDELAFLRARWNVAEAEASIAAFCRKWGVIDDERSFGGVRQFLNDHVAMVDPLRPPSRVPSDRSSPMRPDDFRQTRSGLMDLALEQGYSTTELTFLANCYQLAQVLMDGGYRPCGRPFIDHLVGTASALLSFGFRADVAAAGLLHSAYTHCPPLPGGPAASADAVSAWLGGKGSALEARVRLYTLREQGMSDLASIDLTVASLTDAEIIAIIAANEIDLHLSGEFRYTGRSDWISATRVEEIRGVCDVLGVPGMYETLRGAREAFELAPPVLRVRTTSSYRIGADRRTAVPMSNNVLRAPT